VNPAGDLKDYRLYRATFSDVAGPKTLVATVAAPGTTHQDAGLTNSQAVYYQLTARDLSLGESVRSAEEPMTPTGGPPATAPANFRVFDTGAGLEVKSTWTVMTDVLGYEIWRSIDPSDTGVAFEAGTTYTRRASSSTLTAATTSLTMSVPQDGARYWFIIRAINPAGTGPESSPTSAVTSNNSSCSFVILSPHYRRGYGL
ncbi:MAG: hypothetical protein AAB368_11450, partial [bacterium]